MEDNIKVIKYTYEELLKKREELTSFDDPKNYLKNFKLTLFRFFGTGGTYKPGNRWYNVYLNKKNSLYLL